MLSRRSNSDATSFVLRTSSRRTKDRGIIHCDRVVVLPLPVRTDCASVRYNALTHRPKKLLNLDRAQPGNKPLTILLRILIRYYKIYGSGYLAV